MKNAFKSDNLELVFYLRLANYKPIISFHFFLEPRKLERRNKYVEIRNL